jgi:tryptophanyl-tRNA synthetase
MTQFKSKAGAEREKAGAGLFDYPVLMAADILAYNTNYVPVGEDQKQHVELTRDIAGRFNHLFGDTFTIPEPVIPRVGARIMALDNPEKKMSKSEPSGAIYVLDSPEEIRRKLSRAVTDSLGVVRFNPEQAGLFNLLSMIQALSDESEREIESRFEGRGYRAVKEELADRLIAALQPLQERFRQFEADPDEVDEVLRRGAERARELAHPAVVEARRKMGLREQRISGGSAHAAL